MDFELTASMMCANYGNLEKEVRDLEEGGIDSFHIDIMDGRYVPNFAMSLNDMKFIASATQNTTGRSSYDRASEQQYPYFSGKSAKRRYGLYSSGGGVSSFHHTAEDYQCRDGTGHCHQSRHQYRDGHGDAGHCEEGAGNGGESGQCWSDVYALCW